MRVERKIELTKDQYAVNHKQPVHCYHYPVFTVAAKFPIVEQSMLYIAFARKVKGLSYQRCVLRKAVINAQTYNRRMHNVYVRYVYSAKNLLIRIQVSNSVHVHAFAIIVAERDSDTSQDVTRLAARSARGCSQGCRKALPVASRELYRAGRRPRRARSSLFVQGRFTQVRLESTKLTRLNALTVITIHRSTLTRDAAV